MRLIVAAFAAAFLLLVPAAAQQPHEIGSTAVPAATSTPVATPAASSQTTISTTAPVSSATTINVGTYAGQALMWVASVFGTTIGAALTAWLLRLLKNAGVQGTELLRGKLQDIIVNGLNIAAKEASDKLQGKAQVEVKNAIAARAVEYTQAHGAETLKALGLDPTSPAAVEAIKARIETAINDPVAPTPPVMDGPAKAA